jgi:hypothetical protein
VSVSYALGLVAAGLLVLLVVELLRRRRLRGKYGILWLALAAACLLFAVLPGLLGALSSALGVETPINLLFFAGILTMLAVVMQLSYEFGVAEEKTRTLAEEAALLRMELEQLRRAVQAPDQDHGRQ